VRDDRQAAVVELRTNAGDGQAAALAADLEDAFAPVRDLGADVLVTSDEQIIAEMADDLRDFQVLSIALTLVTVLHCWSSTTASGTAAPCSASSP
jgi:hypothetical protein